jgi:hypothetical protein
VQWLYHPEFWLINSFSRAWASRADLATSDKTARLSLIIVAV